MGQRPKVRVPAGYLVHSCRRSHGLTKSTRSSHTEVGSLKGDIEQRDGVIYEGREPRIGHRASHQGPQEKQRHECRREEKKRRRGERGAQLTPLPRLLQSSALLTKRVDDGASTDEVVAGRCMCLHMKWNGQSSTPQCRLVLPGLRVRMSLRNALSRRL